MWDALVADKLAQQGDIAFGSDDLAVDGHFKLAGSAGLQSGLQAEVFENFGGQTGCLRLVASADAVLDQYFQWIGFLFDGICPDLATRQAFPTR